MEPKLIFIVTLIVLALIFAAYALGVLAIMVLRAIA